MINAKTNDTATIVAAQGAAVAPEKTASRKKGAPKGKKMARARSLGSKLSRGRSPHLKPRHARKAKGQKIVEMIRGTKGATLAEIMMITGWQAHSVRGFISTAGKKYNVKIESVKNDSGDRIYRIAK